MIEGVRDIVVALAPAMPSSCWILTLGVLALLAFLAGIDAATALIPEPPIFFGLAVVTGIMGFFDSWESAANHLRIAIAAGLLIWGVNAAWYRLFKQDALGMGDAKWTMLAVLSFGWPPVVFAWGAGAVLASATLSIIPRAARKLTPAPFSPFLLVGLGVGLYWLRLRP